MIERYFRGKGLDTQDWIFGSLVYSMQEDLYYIVEHEKDELSFPVVEETIGEFTGEKDKYNRDICTKDIVEYKIGKDYKGKPLETHKAEVTFSNGAFGIITKDKLFTPFCNFCNTQFEVIGNTVNNRKLLQDEQEQEVEVEDQEDEDEDER